jgi:hypothetical protein
VLESPHVVRDLGDVVERDSRCLVDFEQHEVGDRRLRALDLGGEHGLLPDVRIEKELAVRE